jgi:hypothetical protein
LLVIKNSKWISYSKSYTSVFVSIINAPLSSVLKDSFIYNFHVGIDRVGFEETIGSVSSV